jgi:protein kinase-like protein
MRARRTIGLISALAAGALGIYAGNNESMRRAAQREVEQSGREADAIRARWQAEQRTLEAHVMEAAAAKPLLAALESHVDGPTLVDLFQSEDWWREARAEFSLTRVVVGDEILATYGKPDPRGAGRDVVATARAERIASSLVELDGRPYFLLAVRLLVLPGRDPVLVVAKAVDTVRLGVIMPAPPVPARGMKDLAAASGAGALVVTAAILLFGLGMAHRAPVPVTLPAPSLEPREPTLRLGSLSRGVGAPHIPRASRPASPGGSIEVRGAALPLTAPSASVTPPRATASSMVPPPRTIPITPGPVGPPRRATAPDGVPTSETGSPGKRFGRYQLLDRLGEGGMSEVFTAAAHGVEGFSRVFVLKRLRPELAHDREAIGQFIDEARMQANLVHSNIVPVFDFGQVGDEFFMTQEYIVGRDLVRLIARTYDQLHQALSPRLSYYFAHETLLALHYAHTKSDREGRPLGIVHRDVSPANVIVSAQGEVKLSDFGIVKSNHRITRTQAGMVKGNVNFMSPEQAKGKDVDARSDLFSMGLVLYYCLTNQFFYDGDNDLDVLFKAACGPTKEHRERLDRLPSPAREILGKALAVDRDERFQSGAEFAESLAAHIGAGKSEAAKLMKTLFGQELLREAA